MEFIDLFVQQARIKSDIDRRIADVLAHGRYVLGPEVQDFEEALAAFMDAKRVVACANGTDALILSLLAWNVGPGDAVFCPSFTYCATAEAIAIRGATPIFVDIERDTYNISPQSLRQAIDGVVRQGKLRPRAILAVDLFGQLADYPALRKISDEFGLKLISDCAQAFGSTLDGRHPTHWADVATTSFFPAKPLGCYGDGGAVLTNDIELADALGSLHVHGKAEEPHDFDRIGLNSRLDSIQAAILLAKLEVFEDEIARRNVIARRYSDGLNGYVLKTPYVPENVLSTWAQYTIEVENPDEVSRRLRDDGIPTARYYPLPIHKQTAYQDYPVGGNGLPQTEDAMKTVISLPMHAYLDEADQDRIIEALKAAV